MASIAELLACDDACELLSVKDAGNLRCCGQAWRGVARDICGDEQVVGPIRCKVLSFKTCDGLRRALKEGHIAWQRLHTVDAANVLDALDRPDSCAAVAGKHITCVAAPDSSLDLLHRLFPRLSNLRRLTLALSLSRTGNVVARLAAANCLQAAACLSNLRELYVELDHCSLEVALLGVLGTLKCLSKLWLRLRSTEYHEAIASVLAARLPADSLEVFGLAGGARQTRALLEALGPGGEVCLPRLLELDLSMDRALPGGRIGEPSGAGGGDVPSKTLWGTLKHGTPGLQSLCLHGALAWYPPVGDAWFAGLVRLVEAGGAAKLQRLDLRGNRIREDVVARLRERLRWRLGASFKLLWDGD